MEEIIKVFGVNWKLLLIQAVNFGVLLLILHRFLYRPLLRLVEERRIKIAQGIQDAADAKQKLQEIEDEKSDIIKKSLMEGEGIVKEAKKRAQEKEKETIQSLNDRSARAFAEAQKAAEDEKEKILSRTREEIARMAVLGAEKILREKN